MTDDDPKVNEPTATLLPCPFCHSTEITTYHSGRVFYLVCDGCEACGPDANSEHEVYVLWNRRAALPPPLTSARHDHVSVPSDEASKDACHAAFVKRLVAEYECCGCSFTNPNTAHEHSPTIDEWRQWHEAGWLAALTSLADHGKPATEASEPSPQGRAISLPADLARYGERPINFPPDGAISELLHELGLGSFEHRRGRVRAWLANHGLVSPAPPPAASPGWLYGPSPKDGKTYWVWAGLQDDEHFQIEPGLILGTAQGDIDHGFWHLDQYYADEPWPTVLAYWSIPIEPPPPPASSPIPITPRLPVPASVTEAAAKAATTEGDAP